ncbi:unnamed protein product, partial [Laminaria digitata]
SSDIVGGGVSGSGDGDSGGGGGTGGDGSDEGVRRQELLEILFNSSTSSEEDASELTSVSHQAVGPSEMHENRLGAPGDAGAEGDAAWLTSGGGGVPGDGGRERNGL